jgi:hypothetical protein
MTERPSSIHTRAGEGRAGRAMRSSPQPWQLSAGRSRSWPVLASHHSNDRPAPNSSISTESSCCSHGDASSMRDWPIRSPAAGQPPPRASRPRWQSPIDVLAGESQHSSRQQVLCQAGNEQKPCLFSESTGPRARSREFVRVSCRISRAPVLHCLHPLNSTHSPLCALSSCAHALRNARQHGRRTPCTGGAPRPIGRGRVLLVTSASRCNRCRTGRSCRNGNRVCGSRCSSWTSEAPLSGRPQVSLQTDHAQPARVLHPSPAAILTWMAPLGITCGRVAGTARRPAGEPSRFPAVPRTPRRRPRTG